MHCYALYARTLSLQFSTRIHTPSCFPHFPLLENGGELARYSSPKFHAVRNLGEVGRGSNTVNHMLTQKVQR